MLGHKLWQQLPARFSDVWVTVRKSKREYESFGSLFAGDRIVDQVDVLGFDRVREVLGSVKPNWILNGIGITKRHIRGESDPLALELNARFPHRLEEWASANQAKVVQFSTDCVFDGRKGNYADSDLPNAQDFYGKTKGEGELKGPAALTLRSSFIGRELGSFTELLEWFLSNRGKKVRGFVKAMYSGLTTIELARIVGELIEKHPEMNGIYNVASTPISKFDLISMINREFKAGVEIEREGTTEVRRELDGRKFEAATGICVRGWQEMIREMAQDPTPYETWRKK